MKKISLLLVILLFGCQSLTEITQAPQASAPIVSQPTRPIDKLDSANLGIQTAQEKKIAVALFLPLSGKNKELGLSLANAAVLSLFDNDKNHKIELVLIDSKETPSEAAKAFEQIVNRKIKIVIGPVFSNLIDPIEKAAKDNEISVISLSNNHESAKKINENGGVFIAGMLPEAQVDKIVSYALQQGKSSFAVIAPNSQYGNSITALFKKIVKNRDGNFVAAEFYKNNDKDLERAVNRVVNSFTTLGGKKGADVSEADRTYPQIIFIPEQGKNLSKIVASIKKQNVDEREFQIIGTSQWDEISTLNDSNLLGAWFAGAQSENFRNFEKIYYQTYNKFPPRISSIAYDSVSVITKLLDEKDGQIPTIKDFIKYGGSPSNGFEGIDGAFRFLPNGLVQRNLAVLQVGRGAFETIAKPNDRFLKY